MSRWVLAVGAVSAAVVLAACAPGSGSSAGADGDAVSLSVQPGTGVTTLIEIADEQGFFADAGVDVTLKTVTAGPAAATALASGSVDIATNAPEVFTPIVDKGTELQVIAGQTRTVGMLAASKDVVGSATFPESVQALAGKKVGVTALSSVTQRLVEMLLKSAGMEPDSVTFVAAGASVDKALMAGRVDAAMITGPQIQRAVGGEIVDVVDLRTPESCPEGISPCGIAQVGMWAQTGWVDTHSDELKKVQEAIVRADEWVHDPANREAVVSIIGPQLGDGTSQAEQEAYTDSQLAVLTSSYPKADLDAWLQFDADNAITTQRLNVDDLMAAGVPQEPAASAGEAPQ